MSRRLRADAARNSEKLLRAAREVYAESGPEAPLESIARRAGVGIATLYRRFPNKQELVRAALEQTVTEQASPAIGQALDDDDPRRGLATLLEAAVSLTAREGSTLAAARNSGILTAELSPTLYEALTTLIRRAQAAGTVRMDLVADDARRIMAMLVSVLGTMPVGSDGWRRYLAFVLDGLSPARPTPLPPAVPL